MKDILIEEECLNEERLIAEHLKIAMEEIGEINPWYDEEVQGWIFSNALYPVECDGLSAAEVKDNYPKYLREFIEARRKTGPFRAGM